MLCKFLPVKLENFIQSLNSFAHHSPKKNNPFCHYAPTSLYNIIHYQNWKEPRFLKWPDKLQYNYRRKYSTMKGNELSCYRKTWMNLKCQLLNQGSQTEKVTHYTILNIWYSGKAKLKACKKTSGCQGFWGRGRKGWISIGDILEQQKYSVWN